jgi:long-chain acyl-CoA synthetase
VTAESLNDGWFATGDIGELDDAGYLRITDRKKDLIKTSGGKYVAPQKVEGTLKAACPHFSQVVVHGEGRKYITALIALDPDAITEWGEAQGHNTSQYEKFVSSSPVQELVEGYVAQANKQLERWETVKRFEILPTELSVEEGEVTPSQKVRRRAVEQRYAEVLAGLYDKE